MSGAYGIPPKNCFVAIFYPFLEVIGYPSLALPCHALPRLALPCHVPCQAIQH
jgi:hypothetical protein